MPDFLSIVSEKKMYNNVHGKCLQLFNFCQNTLFWVNDAIIIVCCKLCVNWEKKLKSLVTLIFLLYTIGFWTPSFFFNDQYFWGHIVGASHLSLDLTPYIHTNYYKQCVIFCTKRIPCCLINSLCWTWKMERIYTYQQI